MFRLLSAAFQKTPRKARPIFLTTAYGVCGGLAAVAFEVGIARFYDGTYLALAKAPP